jgi:hypothetical protein
LSGKTCFYVFLIGAGEGRGGKAQPFEIKALFENKTSIDILCRIWSDQFGVFKNKFDRSRKW